MKYEDGKGNKGDTFLFTRLNFDGGKLVTR